MKKQLVLYILALIIAITGIVFWAYQNSKPVPNDGSLILYYREGCPHCVNVENFMKENNVAEKIPALVLKEGAINTENANEMLKYANQCNLPLSTVGFPFLWNGSECLMGDTDIVAYFTQQIKNK